MLVAEAFGEDVTKKISLNNFLDIAWKEEYCITNWPCNEFPKYNRKDQKAMSMEATWEVLAPWWWKLERDYNKCVGKVNDKTLLVLGTIYQVKQWDSSKSNVLHWF